MRYFLLLLLLVRFASANSDYLWDLNDASLLLPLPPQLNSPSLLTPTSLGSAGELLPQKYLDLIPSLVAGMSSADSKKDLTVVGIRLDPCFPGVSLNGEPCHAQIRMVWQPLIMDTSGVSTTDAAIHTFYELSAAEFSDFITKLGALNAATRSSTGISTQGLPLQVHPILKIQGYSGTYWKELRKILLEYAGESHLVRCTFMTLEIAGAMWDFGGFDITPTNVTRMVIPRIQARSQSFINSKGTADAFQGGERPEVPGNIDTFNQILTRSFGITSSDSALLRASADSAHRIENPTIHSPATIDCVSCHTAQPVRNWMVTTFPTLKLGDSPFKFQSSFNLDNITEKTGNTHLMRAFGYDGAVPAISQRTIHESASVAQGGRHLLVEVRVIGGNQ